MPGGVDDTGRRTTRIKYNFNEPYPFFLSFSGICSGLRGVHIQIPTAVKKGDSATLKCWYDTEGDPLYAVKWYKGGREFYRYAPNESPPVKTFPIGNLTVKGIDHSALLHLHARFLTSDHSNAPCVAAGAFHCNSKRNSDTLLRYSLLLTSPITTLGNRQSMYVRRGSRLGIKPGLIPNNQKTESNATQVVLTKLELEAAGAYSCEVSADAPSFHTAIVYAAMNVVELPSEMPSIQGLKRKYRVDDPLRLNCTSGRSKPAANLTWYINDRQPLKAHVRTYSPLDTNESEWQISQIGLQFLVSHDHFVSGKLKIRCSASIYDIYWQSTEVSAEEDRPRVIHYEPAATIVGINYLQPPPNFQTGQKKPDGQVGVKGNVSSLFGVAIYLRYLIDCSKRHINHNFMI
ncbi:hypothetical protein ALC57_07434 [Trachymyrmex cornetzi]|uniref:Ig-like domain-containing protein n=1 Tax=Trachymyrmex cornetzi TaxID=471704 RepID=A0A195E5L7_9HYME|nr:hypothetical protein ALC57_07434 [Trachymyrmex cornetzi]